MADLVLVFRDVGSLSSFGASDVTPYTFMPWFLAFNPSLRSLRLRSVGFPFRNADLTVLRSLDLDMLPTEHSPTYSDFVYVIQNAPVLRSLSLRCVGCSDLDASCRPLEIHSLSIQELRVAFIPYTDLGLLVERFNFPRLQSVVLHLTSWRAICRALPALGVLGRAACLQLEDVDGCHAMVAHLLPNLSDYQFGSPPRLAFRVDSLAFGAEPVTQSPISVAASRSLCLTLPLDEPDDADRIALTSVRPQIEALLLTASEVDAGVDLVNVWNVSRTTILQ
jgi:hypothetical protein